MKCDEAAWFCHWRVEIEDEAGLVPKDDERNARAFRTDVKTLNKLNDERGDIVVVRARNKLKEKTRKYRKEKAETNHWEPRHAEKTYVLNGSGSPQMDPELSKTIAKSSIKSSHGTISQALYNETNILFIYQELF